jgi:hypothetical protein
MDILTNNDLKEMQEEWNPKHYGDPNHERYIPDPGVRAMIAEFAKHIWEMPLAEFRARMEETDV